MMVMMVMTKSTRDSEGKSVWILNEDGVCDESGSDDDSSHADTCGRGNDDAGDNDVDDGD